MKTRILTVLAVLVLLQGVSVQAAGPKGLAWNANTEADLAGYYIYEAQVAGGQVIGTYMVSVPAPLTSFTFPTGHDEGLFYWRITAYDIAGNQSGFSNEVSAIFDSTSPTPPTGCRLTY